MAASRDPREDRETPVAAQWQLDPTREGAVTTKIPDHVTGRSPQVYARGAGLIYLMATILGYNLLNMFIGLQLLTAPEYAAAFDQGQRQALAFVFLNAQSFGYDLGAVFFALHLAVLGYLVYRSGFLPRILGILLVISGLGYLGNSFTVFLAPQYTEALLMVVVLTALIGELPLTLWLLIKGVSVERWYQRALGAGSW